MIKPEPHPHQLIPEECAADTARAHLSQAKATTLDGDSFDIRDVLATNWIAS